MKKITSLALFVTLLFVSTPIYAQFSWGLKGGVNLGNNDLTILKEKENAFNVGNYTGFFIGPKAEVRIPVIGVGVEVAALYANKGMKLVNRTV